MNKEFMLHLMLLGVVFGAGIASAIETKSLQVLLVLGLTVLFGFITWMFGSVAAPKISRALFRLQKLSWLHLGLKPLILSDENYFLVTAEKNSTRSLFLLWVGSWSLVVFFAHNLVRTFGITSISTYWDLSNSFDVLIFAWILTPIVAFLVIPISVIESSNLRLFLKSKKIIILPTTPYRYLIGGFATINILISVLRGLDTAELITSLVYLPAPFYIMTMLYRTRSEKRLIEDFRNYLRKRGISQKDINLS